MDAEPSATKTLVSTTYRLRQAPEMEDSSGYPMQPYKIVVEQRGEKIRAIVYGRVDKFFRGGHLHFNLAGYKYKAPPAWVTKILEETP